MDNIIKCDRVDFNALVTKNNMRTQKQVGGGLIKKVLC